MIWWIPLVINFTTATCVAMHGDRILAADLARVVPEFAAAPPDAFIGYAPAPGSRRVLHAVELRRLAAKFDVTFDADVEACFEWTLRPVAREDVVRAMRQSLDLPNAHAEVLEMGTRAAPEGKLIFPIEGLMPGADRNSGSALWRGYVVYSAKRRFDLWARVKLSAPTSRVVAATAIAAGHAIEAADVRLDTVEDFPVWHEVARHTDEVVGRLAQHGIPVGHAVLRTGLSQPFEIEAGELVEVTVESGQAHLTTQGRAQNSGRRGDMISVRNPRSAKVFRARIDGKGKVLVMPGIIGGTVN
jgi:flagella basal body P-ring formation protein FlgA